MYGIHGVKNMFRGTLRYPGWCEAVRETQEADGDRIVC